MPIIHCVTWGTGRNFYFFIKNHLRLLTDAAGSEDLVNDLSGDDCTALYYAVLGGRLDNVQLLVERGAKTTINSADGDGLTALHQASVCGYL